MRPEGARDDDVEVIVAVDVHGHDHGADHEHVDDHGHGEECRSNQGQLLVPRQASLALRLTTCRPECMPTSIDIDDKLLEEAQRLGGHKTKKAAVAAAVEEYVRRRRQARIVKLFGTIEYDPGHDIRR